VRHVTRTKWSGSSSWTRQSLVSHPGMKSCEIPRCGISPSAMRAGFAQFTAFAQDAQVNKIFAGLANPPDKPVEPRLLGPLFVPGVLSAKQSIHHHVTGALLLAYNLNISVPTRGSAAYLREPDNPGYGRTAARESTRGANRPTLVICTTSPDPTSAHAKRLTSPRFPTFRFERETLARSVHLQLPMAFGFSGSLVAWRFLC
jgi:hypothetical protein